MHRIIIDVPVSGIPVIKIAQIKDNIYRLDQISFF